MKTPGALLTLFLLLAGCGSLGPAGHVWSSDDRQATIYESDGWAMSIQEYTIDLSAQKLSGHWIERGCGERNAELPLSDAQAAQLVELLARVRLDSTTQRGCATDAPALTLELAEASGATRQYSAYPQFNSCGSPEAFAVKEDVRAVLDACAALLPKPCP